MTEQNITLGPSAQHHLLTLAGPYNRRVSCGFGGILIKPDGGFPTVRVDYVKRSVKLSGGGYRWKKTYQKASRQYVSVGWDWLCQQWPAACVRARISGEPLELGLEELFPCRSPYHLQSLDADEDRRLYAD